MRRLFDSAQPHFAAWLQLYDMDQDWRFFGESRAANRGCPLYYASLCGFRDLAAYIIAEHPEQVNERGGCNHFPLAAALHERQFLGHFAVADFDVAELLHQHGAAVDIRGKNNRTLLHVATYVDVVQWLLSHDLDAESEDDDGWTPLRFAARRGRLEIVQTLLGHGVRINATDETGRTALHLASSQGHVEIVELLLQHRDTDYCTPSHLASSRGKPEVARLLLDHVANIDAKDKDGSTPLHHASCLGKAEVVRLLLDRGANVNAQEDDGSTPLHLVARWTRDKAPTSAETEIVRLLLDHRARVDVKDNNGRTPLQVERVGDMIAQILAEHDA